jgi:IclR family KDG regulon transcriptional repressor
MKLVQSIERALDILEAFTHDQSELGLLEIGKKVGLPKGTTFRILYTLVGRGYVLQDNKSGRYRLGPRAFELGSVAVTHMELRRVAHPHLVELRDITGETVHLVIQDKGEILYIDKVDSPQSIRMNSFVGQRLPMHSTAVGKALLAFLTDAEVKLIVETRGLKPSTPKTITSVEALHAHLGLIRKQGFAVDDEESEGGLCCVAAPIRNYTGKVVSAISISAPVMRLDSDKIPEVAEKVQECARRISYEMGYRQ